MGTVRGAVDGDCVRGCGWGLCERLWMGTVGGAVDGDYMRVASN